MSTTSDKSSSHDMWGGRFSGGPSQIMEAINTSVDIDQRMARMDIEGSIAHSAMLAACGIISSQDADQIAAGLKAIGEDIEAGRFEWDPSLEDVHMNIEAALRAREEAAEDREAGAGRESAAQHLAAVDAIVHWEFGVRDFDMAKKFSCI